MLNSNLTFIGFFKKSPMLNVIIKNFQNPDEVRYFEKGKFELIKLNNMLIGKATYDLKMVGGH